MSDVLASIFTSGTTLTGLQRLALMLPLCLSIAVVYKTTRCESPREVPLAAMSLWFTIVLGMYAVGLGLWVAYAILA